MGLGLDIWVVNPFDGLPGESLRPGRYAFLSRLLARRGHRVTWWSSNFSHFAKSPRVANRGGVPAIDNLEIILMETPRYSRNISLHRIWNHYVYARELKVQAPRCTPAPDVIIVSAPPLLAASNMLDFGEQSGARVIVDIQDIWPEAFEVAFPKRLRTMSRTLLSPLRRFADRIYQRADGIAAVSDSYLGRGLSVSGNNQKGIAVPLGVDMELFRQSLGQSNVDLPCVKQDPGDFWVVYIGTIGKSYDIGTILETADRLGVAYPSVRFLIAGNGPQLPEMQRRAQRIGLANVTFVEWMTYVHLTHLLRQCDVAVNAIGVDSAISMPNKVFDYMAAGLPLVSSVKGELERLIANECIGLQYEAGDAKSLTTALLRLYHNAQERAAMGTKARKLAEERFDMNKTYHRFEEMAVDLCRTGGHQGRGFAV